jgi:excisionase family DNA binding protein
MKTERQAEQEVNEQEPRAARPEDRPALRPEGRDRHGETLWEIAEVADYLRIPVSSIYKMTARKAAVRIPHIRIGGKLRFKRDDIDRWLSLLTVSNLDTLTKVRRAISKRKYGNDPQAQAP